MYHHQHSHRPLCLHTCQEMDELSPSALHSQSKGDGGQFLDAVEAQLYNTHGTTGVKRSATDIVIVNNTNIY